LKLKKKGDQMHKNIIFFLILTLFTVVSAMTPLLPPSNYDNHNAGTAESPYLISNLANLRWLSETPEAWGKPNQKVYYKQTAAIDATHTQNWHNGTGFRPIALVGSNDEQTIADSYFYGEYDGQNFTIMSLYINHRYHDNITNNIGLFSTIRNSSLRNIRIENATIYGNKHAAPLVGIAIGSQIFNCHVNRGQVVANSDTEYHGGLVAGAFDTSIESSSSSVSITGDHFIPKHQNGDNASIGGLVGFLGNSSQLKNSFFTGVIYRKAKFSGGLVGTVEDRYVSVRYCYVATREKLPTNQFFTDVGKKRPKVHRFGAIAGSAIETTIVGCYFDAQATGTRIGVDQLQRRGLFLKKPKGLKTADMRKPSSYKGWDFEKVWIIIEGINNDYPSLQSLIGFKR
jgi:hypothetical protein